ncbi:PREDICTED: uncharacterized protein LOC107357516 [Acropora digitifera]|uniref:uncharacterized protein LOC107357516 n=1 Tax=Acropora digitifera TaxID=70779 RepID=UPI00077AAB00|nr:PREDICTED: uncharacterized protein LOC107357516 [Acropora digitifera]
MFIFSSSKKENSKTVSQSPRSPRHSSAQKASKHVLPKSKRQTVVKYPWTKEENRAVLYHLGRFTSSGVVPGKGPCEECIKRSQGALSSRSWTAVKFFVKNEVEKRKRRVKK